MAARLLAEGVARLQERPESALVALKQAFVIERQIGEDAARLCAACLGTVQALESLRRPAVELSAVLLQAPHLCATMSPSYHP